MSGKTIVQQVVAKVPAASATFPVTLLPGSYRISVAVSANVTGTTTVVALRPYTNKDHSGLAAEAIQLFEGDDSTAITGITLATGVSNRFAQGPAWPAGVPIQGSISLPFGFGVVITKGTAVENEKLEVTITATPIS